MTTAAILDDLARASAVTGDLIDHIAAGQWTAPIPCTEWNVRDLANHLVGMNLVFTAMFEESPMPERRAGLQWRIVDLLAHGWDLVQATGVAAGLPDDRRAGAHVRRPAAEPAARRTIRRSAADPANAPAIDRLAAFTGRPVPWTP